MKPAVSVKWNTGKFLDKRKVVIDRELARAGQNIKSDVDHRMRAPGKSGKLYRRRNSHGSKGSPKFATTKRQKGTAKGGLFYRASAPGQAPAVDDSELVTSIGYAVRGGGAAGIKRVAVGVTSAKGGGETLRKRAIALELGAKLKPRGIIAPRPAFKPALETEKKLFPARLNAALRKVK